MLRRVTSVCLLWLGLSGLLPAAFACTMDMPMPREECCPGHDSPCNDHGPTTPAQIECCALAAAAAPIAIASVEKAKRVFVDDLPDAMDRMWASVSQFAAPPPREAHPPPRALQIDQSSLWLQTARLRL